MLVLAVALLSSSSTLTGDTDTTGSMLLPTTRPPPRDSSHGSKPLSASNPEPVPGLAGSLSTQVERPPPLPFSPLPRAPVEPVSRPSQAPPLTRLPLESQEFMPDGLPASAVRCTRDGGVYTCGVCRTDGDCPPGRACLPHRETRRFECMESECEEDVHCFPGLVCRALNSGVTPIRRCVPEGHRQEGEPCDTSPASPQATCREGLRCVLGVCGPACLPDDPGSCPADHVCEEGHDGSACVPDCRRRGCPEDQRCKQLHDSRYQCLRVDHGSCPETPCPEGYQCNMAIRRGRGIFWCGRTCDSRLAGSCPTGEVCGTMRGRSTCYRQCDPRNSDACGEGWRCASGAKDMSFWGCMPDFAP